MEASTRFHLSFHNFHGSFRGTCGSFHGSFHGIPWKFIPWKLPRASMDASTTFTEASMETVATLSQPHRRCFHGSFRRHFHGSFRGVFHSYFHGNFHWELPRKFPRSRKMEVSPASMEVSTTSMEASSTSMKASERTWKLPRFHGSFRGSCGSFHGTPQKKPIVDRTLLTPMYSGRP